MIDARPEFSYHPPDGPSFTAVGGSMGNDVFLLAVLAVVLIIVLRFAAWVIRHEREAAERLIASRPRNGRITPPLPRQDLDPLSSIEASRPFDDAFVQRLLRLIGLMLKRNS
jgi:hypothetical protein